MKIYKVWQDDVCGYNTYDSAVIIAEGINRAKLNWKERKEKDG